MFDCNSEAFKGTLYFLLEVKRTTRNTFHSTFPHFDFYLEFVYCVTLYPNNFGSLYSSTATLVTLFNRGKGSSNTCRYSGVLFLVIHAHFYSVSSRICPYSFSTLPWLRVVDCEILRFLHYACSNRSTCIMVALTQLCQLVKLRSL